MANDIGESKFTMQGPMREFDARTTPIRGDLADITLAGRVFTPHYVVPMPHVCAAATAPIRHSGGAASAMVSELLHGEGFAVLDMAGGWAWGYTLHDGYLGYVALDALAAGEAASTHVVVARGALVFGEADIKSAVIQRLPMGARVEATGTSECGAFVRTAQGFISHRHLAKPGAVEEDCAALAERLTGAPYLWGGRSGDGLDCSGLVQMVLGLKGKEVPRDTDQQRVAIGRDLGEDEELQRGDIVFFPGHVGIMADGDTLTHANAHWMQVVTEPLAAVLARFPEATEEVVLARKRLTP